MTGTQQFIFATATAAIAFLSLAFVKAQTPPMNDLPRSPSDRIIDELGSRVKSLADAENFVDSLIRKYQLDERTLPGLNEFRNRLALAEYAASKDLKQRIPELVVVDTFNQIMDEWRTPKWSRVSHAEFRAFRMVMAFLMYPKSVPRDKDGEIPPECRPVEAIYLLYLLDHYQGVPRELREQVRSGVWPGRLSQDLTEVSARKASFELKPDSPDPDAWSRRRQYLSSKQRFFAKLSSVTLRGKASQLLLKFGINRQLWL